MDYNKIKTELSNVDPIILFDILTDGNLKHIINKLTDYETLDIGSRNYILEKFKSYYYFDYWKDIKLTLSNKIVYIEFSDINDHNYIGFGKKYLFYMNDNIKKYTYTKIIPLEEACILIREFKFKELEK